MEKDTPESMTWEHKGSHFEFYLAAPCPVVEIWSKTLSRAKKDSRFPRPQGTGYTAQGREVSVYLCIC